MSVLGIGSSTEYEKMFGKTGSNTPKAENEQAHKSFVEEIRGAEKKAPYQGLAKNGVITYKGVTFVCDTEHNRLCLGDVSDPKKCLNISLSGGGSLLVNRDNFGDLSQAISMFSPEDIDRILSAMSQDKMVQERLLEMEETKDSVGENTKAATETSDQNYRQMLQNHMNQMYTKIQNGEIDEKFQIGAKTYTIKEWNKVLERFDKVQEELRKLQRENLEKQKEEKTEKEHEVAFEA